MDENTRKGMNPMATGLAGMAIGAGIGAAATKLMSDKKMRDKVFDTVNEAKDKIVSYAHRISRETRKAK